MWPSWCFIPQKISICFNGSGFPKSSLLSRNFSMLLFTVAAFLNLFITSCIHCWTIPPTLTLNLAMQLALANGILAVWCKQKLGKKLCIRAYSLLLLFGTLILAEQEAWSSLLEDELVEQIQTIAAEASPGHPDHQPPDMSVRSSWDIKHPPTQNS